MRQILFSIGPFNVYGYGLAIAVGIIVAFTVAMKRAGKFGLDPDAVFNIGLFAGILGFIGAKVLFCIVEWKSFIADPMSCLMGFGFVVYGGLIGGVAGGILYCKIKKYSGLEYFDLIMPSIALAQGFGRIGCLLAGCCYGMETDLPIGIVFHDTDLAPCGVKLFPTQIFSSLGDFLIAGILIWWAKRNKKPGNVGFLYVVLYSVGRFCIEFVRADYRGSIGPLSTSQFISILVIIAGLIAMKLTRQKANDIVEAKHDSEKEEV